MIYIKINNINIDLNKIIDDKKDINLNNLVECLKNNLNIFLFSDILNIEINKNSIIKNYQFNNNFHFSVYPIKDYLNFNNFDSLIDFILKKILLFEDNINIIYKKNNEFNLEYKQQIIDNNIYYNYQNRGYRKITIYDKSII